MSDNERQAARPEDERALAGGMAGLSAVGTVAGASVARSLTRRVTIDDPYEGEDFGLLDADRSCVVTTPDGVTWRSGKSARTTRRSPSCSPTASV